jgi:hypothetical protein
MLFALMKISTMEGTKRMMVVNVFKKEERRGIL